MLELTGMDSVLRGIGILYWILAIAVVSLAFWRPKTWQRKALWGGLAVFAFGLLPGKMMIAQAQRDAYAKEAWAYFKKKCDTEAGEKIYKTYTGVKSVLVVKPLPPASDKDHFDQFWYGDPYSRSATSERAKSAATMLTLDSRRASGIQRGLDFVEVRNEFGTGYTRISRPLANDKMARREDIQEPVSRFGVLWEDISTAEDRKYWVAGSRFHVIDLTDKSVVAERIGYLIEAGFGSRSGGRRPWLVAKGLGRNGRSCPVAHDYVDQWFITNVFKQDGGQ